MTLTGFARRRREAASKADAKPAPKKPVKAPSAPKDMVAAPAGADAKAPGEKAQDAAPSAPK